MYRLTVLAYNYKELIFWKWNVKPNEETPYFVATVYLSILVLSIIATIILSIRYKYHATWWLLQEDVKLHLNIVIEVQVPVSRFSQQGQDTNCFNK